MDRYDAAGPGCAHVGLGYPHLLGKKFLWLALEPAPLLGQ